MKKNLKKGIDLIRYGAAFKMNLVLFVLMFVLGIVFEIAGFGMQINENFKVIDLGAVFCCVQRRFRRR